MYLKIDSTARYYITIFFDVSDAIEFLSGQYASLNCKNLMVGAGFR
jgi:hypothetical protein